MNEWKEYIMVKLYKLKHDSSTYWCFAPNKRTAKKIIQDEVFEGKSKTFTIVDETKEHLTEDGVSLLIQSGFVGIPTRKLFMLNGSMSEMTKHYETNGRSAVLWCSEKHAETTKLWGSFAYNISNGTN